MVTTATRDALLLVYAPVETSAARLEHVLAQTASRMQAFTGAAMVPEA
jgi:hypothetical protein